MMDSDEKIKMSFGFASDIAKQLIVLSTAVISICVALTDKLFTIDAAQSYSKFLLIAIVLFVLSILSGLLCMMAISGTLGKPESDQKDQQEREQGDSEKSQNKNAYKETIYQSDIRSFMISQIGFFFLAIIFSVVFVFCSVKDHPSSETSLPSKPATGVIINT